MSLPAPAQDVESILALDPIDDPDILDWPKRFIARELGWIPIFDRERTDAHGLYGGQAIAQSVWAACQTVPRGFDVHSTHGYFLRPGNSQERIVYCVFEVRTGRGYATRRIEAIQFDKVIYTSFASFKANFSAQPAEEDLSIQHSLAYPEFSWMPKYDEIAAVPKIPDVDMPGLLDFTSYWKMPVQYRKFALDQENEKTEKIDERHQLHFFKTRWEIKDKSHNFQAVYMLYSSDRNFLFTATNAHMVTSELAFAHVASLDHSMIFHRPLGTPMDPHNPSYSSGSGSKKTLKRPDASEEWVTYLTQSPASGNSRSLVTGTMWDKQGRHFASVMQEAMTDVNIVGDHEAAESSEPARKGRRKSLLTAGSRLKKKYKL